MNHAEDSSRESRESLLAECLAAYESGGPEKLESTLADHPEHADDLRKHVSSMLRLGLLGTDPIEDGSADVALPERFGDFVRGRRLGGGGMGVVYEADQLSLGRKVAIKLIRPDRIHLQSARERFRTEVETIAGLQHPGIVPVYGAGEEGDLPYYAMELVDGCTLEQAIQNLSGRQTTRLRGSDLHRAICAVTGREEDAPEFFAGTWEEVCIRIVRDVATALHHAHEHGVVHRDLKPSNILITAAGRALLFDFGLTVTQQSTRLTQEGSPVGSPAYMAPEIIREEGASVRSDVYALGITLYELLTLEMPFLARTVPQIQAQILGGEVVPPRHRHRGLSWEIETVCLKAIDPVASHRYPSARELAADLDRVLKHEPITARRPGAALRMRRFCQRRPAVAVGVALGTLLFVGGPTTLWVQQRAANEVIAAQRNRAEQYLATAIEAVDHFVREVGSDRFQYMPHLERLGRDFVQEALTFYEGLLEHGEDDADSTVRRRLASTQATLSHVFRRLGRWQEARQAAAESLRLAQELLQEAPTDPGLLGLSARSHQMLGIAQRRLNEHAQAESSFRAAAEAGAALEGMPGQRRAALLHTGNAYKALAALHTSMARYEDSARLHEKAIERLAALTRDYPKDQDYGYELAHARRNFSICLGKQGLVDRAIELLVAARNEYERLLGLQPGFPSYRYGTADCLNSHGLLLRGKEAAAGVELIRQAVEILEKLVEESPGVQIYREELADSLDGLGGNLFLMGEQDAAARAFETAREHYRALVEEGYGHKPGFVFRFGSCLRNIALVHEEWEQLPEAEERIREAMALVEPLFEKGDLTADQRYQWSRYLLTLADILRTKGENQEAERVYAAARTIQEQLVDEAPLQKYYRMALGDTLNNLGIVRLDLANEDGAVDAFRQAEAHYRQLLEQDPEDLQLRHYLAGSLYNVGYIHTLRDELDQAGQLFEKASSESLIAVQGNPRHGGYSRRLLDSLDVLGRMARNAEDFDAVWHCADAMVGSNPGRKSCRLAAASLLAITLQVMEQHPRRQEFADKAMSLLQYLAEKGYRNETLLQEHPQLSTLKGEEGYAQLIETLQG